MEGLNLRICINCVLLQKLRSYVKNDDNKALLGAVIKPEWEEFHTERLRDLATQLKEQAIIEKISSK